MANFFYDQQIRRFLLQFARILSNWQVTFGNDPQGNPILKRVPIVYGDQSRQAATIIGNNSTSNLPSVPLITYWISGFEYDQSRTQDPYFVQKVNVRQRYFNPETGEYENTQGNAFTVERLMPVPYKLSVTVEFWTSNYQQKLELVEQLGVLFNPSMEIQSTDNFIDWTSLSVVYQDGLTFETKTIPSGTSNPISVMQWKFYMPIWLSTPVKVQKLGIIHKVIASIFKGAALSDMKDDDLLLGTREKITPYGYKILWVGNTLQILPQASVDVPSNSDIEPEASIQVTGLIDGMTNQFLTTSVCRDVAVGQVVKFPTLEQFVTIQNITYDATYAANIITVSIPLPELLVGTWIDLYPKENPNTAVYWTAVLNAYGKITPGVSMITLEHPELDSEIRGTIAFNPNDDRLLFFSPDPDTLPLNSLPAINSVIDPTQRYPSSAMYPNGGLPSAVTGQRYLLVKGIGTSETATLRFYNVDRPNSASNANSIYTAVTISSGTSSNIPIQIAFDADPNTYANSVVIANVDGSQVFAGNTTISAFGPAVIGMMGFPPNQTNVYSNVFYSMDISTPTIGNIPAGWLGQITTSDQIVTAAWGNLVANANDIIEYDGTKWFVSYDSQAATKPEYVTNLKTLIQYHFNGDAWMKSYEGYYAAGDWNVVV